MIDPLANRIRNPHPTITIEIDTHERALKMFREHNMDAMTACVASLGVLESAISDPIYTYSPEQMSSMVAGLARARADHGGSAGVAL